MRLAKDYTQTLMTKMKTVLFVCIENACRSQMAEAFFNKFSKKGKAISAGTKPSIEVDLKAIRVMGELGIDMSNQRPKTLTREMVKRADKVITMGCMDACPVTLPRKTIDWQIEDPAGKSIEKFREVRDVIKKKVKELIDEMPP